MYNDSLCTYVDDNFSKEYYYDFDLQYGTSVTIKQ